jgi:PAS domain S-box-containing protein
MIAGRRAGIKKPVLHTQPVKVIRVLLIEDNPGYCEVIRIMLDKSRNIRFELASVKRLSEGFNHLADNGTDLILLDLKLPDSEGIETFDKVYAHAQGVPIIVLTVTDNDVLALEAVQKGAQDYLVKEQVDTKSLVHAIRYAVERKRMEGMLLTAAQEWRTTFDAIGDVVCLIDSQRNIIRCNKAMTELLKMPFADIINKSCCELIHGTSKPIEVCPYESLRKTRHREEIILQWRDRWFRISVDPLIDEGENLIGGVHIITDITKDREIDTMKSELISNVSHELRTPLSTIKEGIALLYDGALGPLHIDQKDMLSRVQKNIFRLSRLIEDLLDMSNIETGGMEMKKSLIDISALAEEVLSSFYDQANRKNIRLVITNMKDMLPMYIDGYRISQVLTNLIDNSIKFTPANGRVTVKIKDSEKEAEISVSDTGIGISSKNISGLFGIFAQFNRDYGPGERGTGLGLSISKEIIEMHGGRIWVESEPGKGSTFTFTLPRLSRDEIFCNI